MAAFIKNYQTLIVGFLGFSGVIATLVANAWLARKADIRKICHEAKVLRTALIEEMKIQRDALIHAEENSTERTGHDVLTPLQRCTDIFDKSIDKLGLLTSNEVAAVLDAYLPLKELTPKIRLLELRVPPDRRGVEYGEAPAQDYALVAHDDLAGLHSVYVPSFERAIKLLSSHLDGTPQSKNPD
jgi:hypothetical protein